MVQSGCCIKLLRRCLGIKSRVRGGGVCTVYLHVHINQELYHVEHEPPETLVVICWAIKPRAHIVRQHVMCIIHPGSWKSAFTVNGMVCASMHAYGYSGYSAPWHAHENTCVCACEFGFFHCISHTLHSLELPVVRSTCALLHCTQGSVWPLSAHAGPSAQ